MRLAFVALALPLALAPFRANARPQHFSVQVKAAKGGATITCMARSDEQYYTSALVGLVPSSQVGQVTRESAQRTLAKVSVSAPHNQAVPVTIHVPYGKDFKPGDRFHVVSAWPYGGSAHVWGAVSATDPSHEVTLPGALSPAKQASARASVARTRGQIASLRTTHSAATAALKSRHAAQTTALQTRHAAALTRAKQVATARRAKFDARLAAATPRSPATKQIRALIQADSARARNDLQVLKVKQGTALRDLKSRQTGAQSTLKQRHEDALAKLRSKLSS